MNFPEYDNKKPYSTDQKNRTSGIGNASNPEPPNENVPSDNNQLLDEQAEKYLREGGNIEDLPDAEDWQEANKILKEEDTDSENK